MLRQGNHASAKYWRRVLMPVIDRTGIGTSPTLFEREGFRYANRPKSHPVMERRIARWMTRPVGRPSHQPKVFYHDVRYRAGSWDQARRRGSDRLACQRVVPTSGLHVTNLKWRSKRVVRFYYKRGTAE